MHLAMHRVRQGGQAFSASNGVSSAPDFCLPHAGTIRCDDTCNFHVAESRLRLLFISVCDSDACCRLHFLTRFQKLMSAMRGIADTAAFGFSSHFSNAMLSDGVNVTPLTCSHALQEAQRSVACQSMFYRQSGSKPFTDCFT